MSTDFVHSFDDSYEWQEARAKELDSFFSKWYEIISQPLPVDKIGIDRIWIDKNTHVNYSIEYKSDRRTAETGNAFVETVSVDTANKLGWAYTCAAQFIAYYVPQWHRVALVNTIGIKNILSTWIKRYPVKKVKNESRDGSFYFTHGIPVPFNEFITCGLWQEFKLDK